MQIKLRWLHSSFLLTTVYGPTDDNDKARFMEELTNIKPAASIPWLVLGDYNLIYEARDKNNLTLNRWLMGTFRHTLNTCELLEIALQNRRYTWSNEREELTLVRLDRVFFNKEWELMYSDFTLQALSSSLSDHCPLFLCQQARPLRREVFRFENFWVRVPGFMEVVKDAWQEEAPGFSPLNRLFYKLQRTTTALRRWSSKLFDNARLDLHIANEVVHRLDMVQDNRQLSQDEFQLRKELKARVLRLAAIERSRRRQSSHLIWLKEGDVCTRFFHLNANGRRRKNYIPCLKNGYGNYVRSHEEKEQSLFEHF
jgi:hypothetical protein